MTPLRKLIDERLTVLGITRGELAKRLGYVNVSKALRRLDRLCEGNLSYSADLLSTLPKAIEVERTVVDQAIEERKEQIRLARQRAEAEAEAHWRATFRPHAIILTEHRVPTQITICAFAGGERFIWVDLDLSQPRARFIHQALEELARRQRSLGRTKLPFFGAPTGVVVNLSPHRAIRYDLDGRAVELLPRAYRIGRAVMSVR